NSNLKNCSLFVANSEDELKNIKALYPTKPVALIPHGISEKFLNNPKLVNPIFDNIIGNRKAILFLSRLHPIKGLERLIEAVSLLSPSKIENVVFIIAGNGDENYKIKLQNLINGYNLNKHFEFTGFAD